MKSVARLLMAFTLLCIAAPASAHEGRREVSETFVCQQGWPRCVDRVVRQMTRRFDHLARRCDHDAIFALTYLRTTEIFRATLRETGYQEPRDVIRQDALFADFYFRAFDAYHRGTGPVPPAWQIAFDAAENRTLTAAGNALLGFNAHINRDLPLTLYELFLNGTPISEEDHFVVNDFLAQVDFTQEIIDRFDPNYPTEGDSAFIFEWRNTAWINYQRLVNAADAAEVEAISAEIEATAASIAQLFVLTTAYPPGEDSTARDDYCRANRHRR